MVNKYDVVVVGGGLAGLTTATHLAKSGLEVLILEKNHYPIHKVCGEYLSREVVPYLENLGIYLGDAPTIDKLEFSGLDGNLLRTSLPLGGIGISRYSLDHRLYKNAELHGVSFVFESVVEIRFKENEFLVRTIMDRKLCAPMVIGAHGKRSALDKSMDRQFMNKKAPWLGVKAHYRYNNFPSDLVGLHSFPGGYGGLSLTETGAVNFCYLANYKSFGQYADIELFNQRVVSKNQHLRDFLKNAEPLFEKPLTIAQISFEKKALIEDHVIMCGDSAGLNHPLCGNGMAMAIRSAEIVAIYILKYFRESSFTRSLLESYYSRAWKKEFKNRLWWGRQLQSLLLNPGLSEKLIWTFTRSDRLTKALISKTHGKLLHT